MMYRGQEAIGTCTGNPESAERTSQRILVVDDDPDLRHLNMEALKIFGFQVEGAEDGVEAWEALQQGSYDLLVTDHNMPRMTGVELIRGMREAGMDLPVIMATASYPHEEFDRTPTLREGVMTLLKPYGITDLLERVEKALQVNVVSSHLLFLNASRDGR